MAGHDLQGDRLFEAAVGPLRQVDGAHASASQQPYCPVRAELGGRNGGIGARVFSSGLRVGLVRVQQALHFAQHPGVISAL